MSLIKLLFRPGINKDLTSTANEGGWFDSDKVRFRAGMPEKIGGWVKYTNNTFVGVCRLLFNWLTLGGSNLLAVGTHKKFFVEEGGAFNDITPIRLTVSQANAITTGTAGSTTVTFSTGGTAHGANAGDFVIVSSATALDGIPAADFNKEQTIVAVPTATTFTVVVATPCTLGGQNGGGTPQMQFLYSIGNAVNAFGTGWGAGTWSRGTWGSGSASSVASASLRLWSADNFGEDLIFCPRGGPLFFWDSSSGYGSNRGVYVSSLGGASGVPTTLFHTLVTPERYTIAFGCTDLATGAFDPLLIRWSNQEDYKQWTPAAANTAGDLRLNQGSNIVTAIKTRQEILVWTDSSVHSLQYLGPPLIFGQQTLAANTTLISPNAAIAVNNSVFWMGKNQFYVYTGRVEVLPCAVRQFIFQDINMQQSYQVSCGLNEGFGEITWFYSSNDATNYQIDKYVTYNFVDNVWYYGTMNRTTWLYMPARDALPYATTGGYDSDAGYLYSHEVGNDDGSTTPATAITAYAKTADIDIGDGEHFMFVDKVLPDFQFNGSSASTPQVNISVAARRDPGGDYLRTDTRVITDTDKSINRPMFTEQLWMRLRGRQVEIEIRSSTTGVKWRLGALRLNTKPDGRR